MEPPKEEDAVETGFDVIPVWPKATIEAESYLRPEYPTRVTASAGRTKGIFRIEKMSDPNRLVASGENAEPDDSVEDKTTTIKLTRRESHAT